MWVLEMEDPSLGQIRVSKWTQLHFYHAPQQTLSLLKIEQLKPTKTGNVHRGLWLIWVGEEFLSLEKIWTQYSRRFGVDHWYRFAKQRLHWTLPNFRTPIQCQRWSDLIINTTWQLWLAKKGEKETKLKSIPPSKNTKHP